MNELVGTCGVCGKDLYCTDGFFQGYIIDEKNICYTCFEQNKKESDE
ncbi:hypothetical protein [Fictibacillus phosphorivorans]|nr:hypothetical protein [Fictibacillus phosphorivorans]